MGANRSAGIYQPRSRKGQIADALSAFRSWAVDLLAETLWRSLGIALLVVATAIFVSLLLYGGRSSRARGVALVGAYVLVATAFFLVGDRNP